MAHKDFPANPIVNSYNGLSKREYAAIQAMNGLLAGAPRETSWDSLGFSNAAKWSVQVADALFDELEKEAK